MHTSAPTPSRRALSKPAAFTLIELLTVIAIIGILAAILIPTVGKVRQTARRSSCASNQRQIGVSILAFTADNKDWLPGGAMKVGTWNLFGLQRAASPQGWVEGGVPTQDLVAQIYPYAAGAPYPPGVNKLPMAKSFICPSNMLSSAAFEAGAGVPSYYLGTGVYVKNVTAPKRPFGKATGTRAVRLTDLANPQQAVALFDVDNQILAELGDTGGTTFPATAKEVHENVRNFLFLDGHVKSMPLDFKPAWIAW